MEYSETFVPNRAKDKIYEEKATPFTIDQYNERLINSFDIEFDNFQLTAKNIGNPSVTENTDVESTPISNKPFPNSNIDNAFTRQPASSISIDDIYFEPEFTSSEFQTVLKLLAEAVKYSELSIDELKNENFIASDEAVHHIQVLLPELFCCRNLSKSFESIINAVQNALINNRGRVLSEEKLIALNVILKTVRNSPFMNHDNAIDLIMDFEDHDFTVEPSGFDLLSEFFDE